MKRIMAFVLAISALLPVAGWGQVASPATRASAANDAVTGAWRAKVQFKSGMLADWKNLEFMYAFNQGGTMTESSNYDGSPPGPPAYGVWRKTGARQFEARYEVFLTKSAKPLEEIAKGGGWLVPQSELTPEKLAIMLQKTERTTLVQCALRAKTMQKIDATAHLVAACEELAR